MEVITTTITTGCAPGEWPEEELYARRKRRQDRHVDLHSPTPLCSLGSCWRDIILRHSMPYWQCTELAAEAFRCTGGAGHAVEPTFGIEFTAGLTFLLICSSVTMVLAFAAAQENNRKELVKFLNLTILGGCLFLYGQYEEYFGLVLAHGLTNEGLIFGHSAYASTFYLITSFHGCHVLSGVIYLSVIRWRAGKGDFDGGHTSEVELVGLFWHFVDLIWIIVFTLIYLFPEDTSLWKAPEILFYHGATPGG